MIRKTLLKAEPMTKELYFDDFEVGQEFPSDTYTITKEGAINFAKEYDPQYFHIDEEAAKHSAFGKLAVSGWQTMALSMRLKAGTDMSDVAGGMIGMGLENVKWLQPVYPGDTIHVLISIADKRRSQSKPTHGVVKYRMETFNQKDEKVLEMTTAIWVPC